MAKIDDDPVFGKLSGKVGPVVVVRCGNLTYLRSKPHRGKVKSSITKMQNSAFKDTVKYLHPFKEYFDNSMQIGSAAKGWNRALSLNLKFACDTVAGITTLVPHKVIVASGPLAGLSELTLATDNGSITVTWNPNAIVNNLNDQLLDLLRPHAPIKGSNMDRVTILAKSEEGFLNEGCATRKDGRCSINLYTPSPETSYNIYIFTTSPTGEHVSFSQYVGNATRDLVNQMDTIQ